MKNFFYAAVGALVMGALWYYSSQTNLKPKRLKAHQASSFGMPSSQDISQDEVKIPTKNSKTPISPEALQLQQQRNIEEKNEVSRKSASATGSHSANADDLADVKGTVKYVVEDGLAIVDGDIILGEPTGSATSGSATIEDVHLWPGGIVPFHIQEDAPNHEQIIRAIANFSETNIQFIPYNGQEDVLVFEKGQGCRSYLGKIGGKQPIWISGGCSAKEITHEIMHALGFIHEQNRTDRDDHVSVQWENVLEKYRQNFEVFPKSLMKVTGTNVFDYHSIMLYEANAFAKNTGSPTLISLKPEYSIDPNPHLSAGDRWRLKQVYGAGE